jgi:hypothetical protein
VEFDWDSVRLLAQGGISRQVQNLAMGRKSAYGNDESSAWQGHIIGAFGEAAVAKYENRFYLGPGVFRGEDVYGYDAKAVDEPWKCLIVHSKQENEPDDRKYALVYVPKVPVREKPGVNWKVFVVYLVGWYYGFEARVGGYGGKYWRTTGVTCPAFFVPPHNLHPFEKKEVATS